MADLKDKQIRLVGSQNFAYATGSSYTQGHVHFTTDDHGSIVVNGKVYGTTDATYIYVGENNIPTYIATTYEAANSYAAGVANDAYNNARSYATYLISTLDSKQATSSTGGFVNKVNQKDGIVTVTYNTLENIVTVYNCADDKVYKTGPSDKFITNVEVFGDTVYARWDNFGERVKKVIDDNVKIPSVSVTDNVDGSAYSSKISANGHVITVEKGTYLASYADYNNLKNDYENTKKVVDAFFGSSYDLNNVSTYIDTLAEIQEAFKNSYAEGIANSINAIQYHGLASRTSYSMWITYTTNGNSTSKETAYVNIPYASNATYGLVKYDNYTIRKNGNDQLYVDGELTDTKYSLTAKNSENGAYITLGGTDGSATNASFKGTGIATVSYNSTDKAIQIYVPETVVNYNHHSTAVAPKANDVCVYIDGRNTTSKIISSVSLSADGKLSYTYINLKHETIHNGNVFVGPNSNKLSNNSIIVPKITVNACGHITAYENVSISGIAPEDHSHDEFVWL